MIQHELRKALFIVGPTASGKSELALHIASILKSEIVSADSRQLYRTMDIGTAKPSASERARIPHHLIDIKNPDERCSAGEFARIALPVLEGIFSRGALPIVVGGSGLYIRALSGGLFSHDGIHPGIRKRLKREAEEEPERVYDRLKETDPAAAQRIHPNDTKRIVRALEVYESTGYTISDWQRKNTAVSFIPVMIGLRWERGALYHRIEKRVDAMIASGLVEEVRTLLEKGYGQCDSMDSIGYKEMMAYVNGSLSLEDAIALLKKNTRNLAKKQMTWFRKDKSIHWLDVREETPWKEWAPLVLDKLDSLNVLRRHDVPDKGKTDHINSFGGRNGKHAESDRCRQSGY